MKKGIHSEHTYALVASCNSIRLLLTLSLAHKCKTLQLEYVIELPQAPVEKNLHIKIPKGFELDTKGDNIDYILKIHNNMYVEKHAGRLWYQHLV